MSKIMNKRNINIKQIFHILAVMVITAFIFFLGIINAGAISLTQNQDTADYTYFHSKHYNNGWKRYKNTTFTAESGTSYEAEPADYKNPDKGERIIFTKTNSNDSNSVYFKTDLTKRTECWPNVNNPYKYYYLEGDFKIENDVLDWDLVSLNNSTKTIRLYIEDSVLKFNNGSMVFTLQTVKSGEWHHILALFNLIDHRIDVFYDQSYLGSDKNIDNAVHGFDTLECKLYGGNGSVEMKNWEFTGVVKPYSIVNSSEYGYKANVIHTSVFPDDTLIREYLSDKIVFHGEGKILYKNGHKTALEDCEYTDNEVFVSINEINSAMGLNLRIDNTMLLNGNDIYPVPNTAYGDYLPVKETLSMLGYNAEFAKYGKMVIACKDEGVIFTETEFTESAMKYSSGILVRRQRGFVKTDTVDPQYGTSMLIGMDKNCDTITHNSNQYTFVQHDIDRSLQNQTYEFDVNVLSKPTNNNSSVFFVVRYSDGSTETIFSVSKYTFNIKSKTISYSSQKWYHVKVDFTPTTWKVTVTAPDGKETVSDVGNFKSSKIISQFRFHTATDANNLYTVAVDNIKVKTSNPLIDCSYHESWFDSQYYATSDSYPILSFSDEEEISNFIFFDRPTAEKLKSDFDVNINSGEHPRIIINSDDVARLRRLEFTDKKFEALSRKIISQADSYLETDLSVYSFGGDNSTKGNAEQTEARLTSLAFAYILTGDTKYSDKAIKELMNICEFPDLNAKHIIDTGIWLRGLSVAYDWCYNEMSNTQRKTVEDFIYKEGIEPVQRAYYSMNPAGLGRGFQQVNWFPRWKSNYTAFVQGGLVPACLAIADIYPEECFDTIEKTMRAWEYMLYGFYDDGVWLEGRTYESVVYNGVAYAMAAMLKCLGDDYNVLEYPGLENSFDKNAAMTSFVGSFTYADDSQRGALANINSSWAFFGDYYHNDLISTMRALRVHGDYKTRYFNSFSTPEFMDLIYYDGDSKIDAVRNMPKVVTAEGMDLFSLSEDKTDKNALFFVSSGGVSRHYHQHNDSGDFLFALDGEVWTYEFGSGNYTVGDIYTRFSGRTEAHNTITLNPGSGFSQAETAYAPLIDHCEGNGSGYAIYDMTKLYEHHGANSMKRGFYIGEGYNSLTVRDEMSFSKDTVGYWFMNTRAKMEQINSNTIRLTQNGKTLYAQFVCEADSANAQMSIMECVPLGTVALDGDSQAKTGQKKIGIYFQGSGNITLTVRLSNTIGTIDTTPVSEWKNRISNENYEKPAEPEREIDEILWQEDFEGENYKLPEIRSKDSCTTVEVIGDEDNKELFVYSYIDDPAGTLGTVGLFYDSTLAAKENFTVEYDMKIIPYNPDTMIGYDGSVLKYPEYNTGLSDAKINERAYFTINPYFDGNGIFCGKNASIFGSRNKPSTLGFMYGVNWYDYNRYRWVTKFDAEGNQYAEVYINGKFYGIIGNRAVSNGLKGLMFTVITHKGITESGFYLDNITFYKGQAETINRDRFDTQNDIVTTFSKDFDDLSKTDFNVGDVIYPYYMMRNALYDAYISGGQVSTVNSVFGKEEKNTSLKLSSDATIVFPQAIQIKNTTVFEFDVAIGKNESISIGVDNITNTKNVVSISEDEVTMTDKVYNHKTELDKWHKIRIVIEECNGKQLATIHIDDTIVAFREETDIPVTEFSSQYMNMNVIGNGYVDNLKLLNMRGSFSEISDVAVDRVNDNKLRVRIKKSDLNVAENPKIYAATYDTDGLISVSEGIAMLTEDEYCAELNCTTDNYSELKIFVWDNNMRPLKEVTKLSK